MSGKTKDFCHKRISIGTYNVFRICMLKKMETRRLLKRIVAIAGLPDQYGGPKLTPESRLKLSDFTLETQKYFKKFRNTTSGKFVMKMYAEHR